MSSQALGIAKPAVGYLRGPGFDLTLIFGTLLLAIASGLTVLLQPSLFPLVLLLDLWLLGYHHVIATYTRLCFDRGSFAENRVLLVHLPIVVAAVTVGAAAGIGLWVVGSVYLYWQWFHYTRQSWGVSQVYRRKASQTFAEPRWLTLAAFYLLPLWGILARSHQAPEQFLGMELRVIPVPGLLVDVVAFAAQLALVAWAFWRLRLLMRGELPVMQTVYLLSHFLIFWLAYIAIRDVTFGWLVVNVWHNAQYLLFVWLFNNQRFRAGVDPRSRLLSWLSQSRNLPLYFLFTFGVTTVVYLALQYLVNDVMLLTGAVVVVYMAINFHHYIVDSLIWKARKRPMQKVLGLRGEAASPAPPGG